MNKILKFLIEAITITMLTGCNQKLDLTVVKNVTFFIKEDNSYIKKKVYSYSYNKKGLVNRIKALSYNDDKENIDSIETFVYKNDNLVKQSYRDNTGSSLARLKFGNNYSAPKDGGVESFVYDSQNRLIKSKYECGFYKDSLEYFYNSDNQIVRSEGLILVPGDPGYKREFKFIYSYSNEKISKVEKYLFSSCVETSTYYYDLSYTDGSKYDLVEITSNSEKVVKEIPHSPKYGENGYIVKKYKNGSEDYYEYLEQYFINDYKNEEMVCWSTNETYDVSDGAKTLKTSIVEILTAGEDTEANEKWYEKVITTSEEGKDTTIENQKYVYSFKTI